MRLAAGTRVGTLEILSLLGTGGMGEVYRARDTRLKRDIALKVLPDVWATDPDRLARFHREAELLATLNHSNIAAVYGVEDAAGLNAIVLELVEGPTLADRLSRGPIPVMEALAIARQIADALDAAHDRAIVHRDLKPANIKVREDGMVKVLDFGLAKAVDSTVGVEAAGTALAEAPTLTRPAMTQAGVILGTVAYMSPEQARGTAVDKRTDIWAFGCVLYEMLTGRPAFAGPTISDTIAAVLERTPDWSALPATTPSSVRHLVERCLEKDRRRRLRDIGDARHDLDRVATGVDPAPGVTRSGRVRWFLAGASLVMVVVAAAGLFWMRDGVGATASWSGLPLTRLTSDASFSTEPALSLDGTFVIYASDREGAGQLDLWFQRTAGGQPLRLTDDPADDREPDLSPDGNLIAFRSDRNGGGVYVMPVLGGDARLVAPGGRAPRFSPDGSRLAYAVPSMWLNGLSGQPSALFVVPASGGAAATRIAEGLAIAAFPLWSPDGRSLLFFGGASGDAMDWWWVPVDGGTPVATGAYRVIQRAGLSARHDNDPDIVPATWTKDGVLFSARLGDSVNVWRLEISERSGLAVDTSLERLTHGVGADVDASVDGLGRIAFQVATDVGQSLTLPLDPNAGEVTGPVIAQTFETGEGPGRNSLDERGRLLVYPRRRGTELWVKDLSTGRERHVVTAPGAVNPIISSDGTKVAYGDGAGASPAGYVVPIANGVPRKVCDGCRIHGWFADNRRVLTLEWDEAASRARARAVDTTDLTAVDLIETNAGMGRLDLSPDERWLVFGQREAFRLAPVRPGSRATEQEWVTVLERTPGSAERPCGWSPDGRLLYLLLERDGFRDLYAQRLHAVTGVPVGGPDVVAHFHDPRRRWGSTPFGSAIVRNAFVFTQVETTGSIWLLGAK